MSCCIGRQESSAEFEDENEFLSYHRACISADDEEGSCSSQEGLFPGCHEPERMCSFHLSPSLVAEVLLALDYSLIFGIISKDFESPECVWERRWLHNDVKL
ncbi:uncharacterized protein LOC113856181 [Abrus precatorius]|uniref:Uncharacterized protein LOC113856181 n=1 Tax=Abrus precatorius TaxID=3816 RepID=A0A8B8KIR7_ABRPR|nr:uncharacterized protein LOC113856181 [Abrus precatorius]